VRRYLKEPPRQPGTTQLERREAVAEQDVNERRDPDHDSSRSRPCGRTRGRPPPIVTPRHDVEPESVDARARACHSQSQRRAGPARRRSSRSPTSPRRPKTEVGHEEPGGRGDEEDEQRGSGRCAERPSTQRPLRAPARAARSESPRNGPPAVFGQPTETSPAATRGKTTKGDDGAQSVEARCDQGGRFRLDANARTVRTRERERRPADEPRRSMFARPRQTRKTDTRDQDRDSRRDRPGSWRGDHGARNRVHCGRTVTGRARTPTWLPALESPLR